MQPVDHLFVFLLLVVQPIHGAVSYRRYLKRIEAGEPADPIKLYREIMLLEWLALAALATVWIFFNRPAAELGFVAPAGVNFYVGIVLLVLVCGFLVYTGHRVKRMTDDEKTQQAESLGDLVHFLPRNPVHYRYFIGTSITAGIVEEIVYRGFVIWYLMQFMPVWGAVITSSIFFGLGHSYQGASGMLRTGLIGLGFAVFYVFTGSIWLPIIGHALLDVLQGKSIVEILRDTERAPPASENPSRASG